MGRTRPPYPATFRQEAVALVRTSGKSRREIAEGLGSAEQTLSNWLRQAASDAGHGPVGALTSEERVELHRLRRQVKVLEQEREIWKKSVACCAKETW